MLNVNYTAQNIVDTKQYLINEWIKKLLYMLYVIMRQVDTQMTLHMKRPKYSI